MSLLAAGRQKKTTKGSEEGVHGIPQVCTTLGPASLPQVLGSFCLLSGCQAGAPGQLRTMQRARPDTGASPGRMQRRVLF